MLTAAGGSLAFMLKSVALDDSWASRAFVGLAVAAGSLLVLAAYSLARSYHGYVYQTIPTSKQLSDYNDKVIQYYVKHPTPTTTAHAVFNQYLTARYVEAAEINTLRNESKAAYLYRASQSLIGAIIVTALAAVPWSLGGSGAPTTPQRIEIVRPVSVQSLPTPSNAKRTFEATGITPANTARSSEPSAQRGRSANGKSAAPRSQARQPNTTAKP